MSIYRVPITQTETVYIDVVADNAGEAAVIADEFLSDSQDYIYDLLGSSNNFSGPDVEEPVLYSSSDDLSETSIEILSEGVGLSR